jgi:hypothetical protein
MYFPSRPALRGVERILGVCALTALALLTFAASASAAKTSTAVGYVTEFGTGSNDTGGPGIGSSIFVDALTSSPPGGTYTRRDLARFYLVVAHRSSVSRAAMSCGSLLLSIGEAARGHASSFFEWYVRARRICFGGCGGGVSRACDDPAD